MPTLIHNPGQPDEAAFELAGQAVTIGRAEDASIWIPDKSLSRSHARIDCIAGRFFLIDLESKNGSFVNGVRVARQEIRAGDAITLGDVVFGFVSGAGRGPAPIPAEPRPTVVRELTHLGLEQLLREQGHGGAVKVKRSDAEDKLRVLLEVSKLLSVSAGIDAVLRQILDLVFQILDVDRGAILLVDPASRRLEPRVSKSIAGAGGGGPIYSQKIVDYVASRSLAALFAEPAVDPRLGSAQSIVNQSIRASMCVPLKPKDDVIGVLYVDNLSMPNRFSEEDLEFLAAFASQAAVAIENSALYRRIEEETTRRMELIMEAKLSSLSSLVAGIAHELKNPLNFITNFAQLSAGLVDEIGASVGALAEGRDAGAAALARESLGELRDNVAKIAIHGERADGIINGMLLHARGAMGTREPADFNAAVEESVRLARAGYKGPPCDVVVDAVYDEAVGTVEMVSPDIHRVFINVVNNALYAMAQKKRDAGPGYSPALTLRTASRGDRAEARFRDNGTGVTAEIADKIWNPFFTTKPPGEGAGLGLSLSHDIVVEGHHGTIRFDTEVGEFTEFTITLPKLGVTRGR